MRRALPALLAVVLLSACGSDPDTDRAADEPPSRPDAAAGEEPDDEPDDEPALPGAVDIEGLVVTPSEELSRNHVLGPVEYDTLPPVGGEHNQQWIACDVYGEPVPDEFAVHALEHGAVWLTHAPDLPEKDVERLAELAERNQEHVLVTPYEGLDSRIVAVAWGYSLEASDADDPRLREFVDAFANGPQSPEPGAPCRNGGISPREARGLLQEQS